LQDIKEELNRNPEKESFWNEQFNIPNKNLSWKLGEQSEASWI
jgi:hypothetical protein